MSGGAGKESGATRDGAAGAYGMGAAKGVLRDAWLFFMLLVLLAVVILVLQPARLLDRLFGTRLIERLVSIIERVAEL